MLKYFNYDIVFQEVPDEVTLAVNITGCPYKCAGCHSPHLRDDIGEALDERFIDSLIEKYGNQITCLCFMGGDRFPDEIARLASYVKAKSRLRIAWYSGNLKLPKVLHPFDYVKIGPYEAAKGGLRSADTNQRLFRTTAGKIIDITSKFRRK